MDSMAMVWARIILRYIAGFGAGYGALVNFFELPPEVIEQLMADPDVVLIIAGILTLLTEGLYKLAKAKGWNT